MRAVSILIVIFALVGDFALFGVHMGVVAKDLRSAQLTNSTAQREHELLLKNISQQDLSTIIEALGLESIAQGIGNEFYGISAEEQGTNRENNAIMKALFECQFNLLTLDRMTKLSSVAFEMVFGLKRHRQKSSSLSEMFSYYCYKLDEHFKDDGCYATAKNKYQSQNPRSPDKTYMYGIPKSDDDLRKAIAELLNDPQRRKSRVVNMFFNTASTRDPILELAQQPGKRELVQKVFEKSIESFTSHLKDYNPDEIDLNDLRAILVQGYLNQIFCETLRSNINEHPDLKTDFGPIGEH